MAGYMDNDQLAMIVNDGTAAVMDAARDGDHLSVEQEPALSVAMARMELERRLGVNGADAICDKYRTRGVGWAFIHRK